MTDAWRLDTLPFDVLILIFDYCHAFDLVRLSEVCTRFYEIIRRDTLWIKKSKQPLVTNQASRKFRERCNPLLCLRKKWHVLHNWQCGRYDMNQIYYHEHTPMTWIQLTGDTLWWSGGDKLCGFKRVEPFRDSVRIFNEINIGSDICKFVVRDECIITGHRDGSIMFWTKSKCGDDHFYSIIEDAHSCYVSAVEETHGIIVSGSDDETVKIWTSGGDSMINVPAATLNVADKVWSIAANPIGTKFAVGFTGNAVGSPLRVFDLECYSESAILKCENNENWQRGAGVYDMVWDNPQTLLTCGYDTYVRKWDMRTETCVGSWPDPTDAAVYCIATDYHYTMVTGTQINCKAVLWDQRQSNYVQMYFMTFCRNVSPIYGIGFDSSHLYGSTDRDIVELKFSGHPIIMRNYSKIRTCRIGLSDDRAARVCRNVISNFYQ